METLRKIIEEKKRKGEEKKPYYGIRKLSVGWAIFSFLHRL